MDTGTQRSVDARYSLPITKSPPKAHSPVNPGSAPHYTLRLRRLRHAAQLGPKSRRVKDRLSVQRLRTGVLISKGIRLPLQRRVLSSRARKPIPFSSPVSLPARMRIRRSQRLGGLLNFCERRAA
jgi:hypothetical protein